MIKGFQKRIRNLPTLPSVLSQIIGLLEADKSSAADIEKVLRNDQALTTKLLAVANSAYYGFQHEITTVRRAVVAVGYNEVRNMCLGLSLMGFLRPSVFKDHQLAGNLWMHSLAVSHAAQVLASRTGCMEPEVAHTAGLLHDIGKVVLAAFFPDEVEKLFTLLREQGMPFSEAEWELGVAHGEVGRTLAEHWKLPELLSEAISRHHAPHPNQLNFAAVSVVHTADYLAHRLGFSDTYRPTPPEFNPMALQGMNIGTEKLKECATEVARGREQIQDLYDKMIGGAES